MDIHADVGCIFKVESMLGIDEDRFPTECLRLGNDMECQRRLRTSSVHVQSGRG